MAWYNPSWGYRVKVTVLNGKVDADLTDYPVYVSLANLPAGFHTNVNQTDGRDIRVTTSDGTTEVPREVVFYDSTTDTGELHFKGNVLNSSDVDFYIYYGNAGASEPTKSDTYGSGNVWNSNYLAVFHFQETVNTTASGYKDATNNNNHGTGVSMASSAVTGKLAGKCAVFGGSEYIGSIPKLLNNNTWSITSFSYFNSFNAGTSGDGIFAQGTTDLLTMFCGLDGGSPYTKTLCARSGGSSIGVGTINSINSGAWYHTGGTFNNTAASFFSNGAAVGTSTVSGGTQSNNTCYLGSWYDLSSGRSLHGKLDEVRIRDDVATSTWISTEYNNLNDPATFFTIGVQEVNSTGAIFTAVGSITGLSTITL